MTARIFIGFALLTVCSSLRILDNPGATVEKEFQTENGPVTLIVGKKTGRSMKMEAPRPFEVKSDLLTVKGDEQNESKRRGRLVHTVTTDNDGIPLIDGVRKPDDPDETRVFRNARIINNILITEEDNQQNQISSKKTTENENKEAVSSHREARIMTGPIEYKDEELLPASSETYQKYPTYQHSQNYEPSRTGLVASSLPDKGQNNNNEKIVTYSYSTSGGDVQDKSTKDVIYGSGFAANPHYRKNTRSSSAPKYAGSHPPFTFNSPPGNFQSSTLWTDFQPSSFPSHSVIPQQHETRVSSSAVPFSFSKVKFPSSGLGQQFTSSTSFRSPSSFSSSDPRQVNNNSIWQFHQQEQQQNIHSNFPSSQLYSPASIPTNQIKRHQQLSKIPSLHEAFGEAGSLIHSGVIPANSENFFVEKATFQSHPGAPAFSVPVPRPISGVQHPHHPSQQHFYNIPQHYVEYPYYEYQDNDNRPILDKMMDPLKRVGQKVRETVIEPVIYAGQRFGNRLRIPERVDKIASGAVGADAIPLVGGAVAVATLGALGAYAASKYSFNDLKRLLPTAVTRSSKSDANVPDILLKLADDLENEDPSFLERFTSSTSWLESSCAQRIFCSLVTSTLREEEEKMEKANGVKKGDKEGVEQLQSRQGRSFFEKEINYIEKQINALLDSIRGKKSQRESKFLHDAANNVVDAVKRKNCSSFTCSKKN